MPAEGREQARGYKAGAKTLLKTCSKQAGLTGLRRELLASGKRADSL